MFNNHIINREFILSKTARSIYRACAWCTLALFVGIIALTVSGPVPSEYKPLLIAVLRIAALATATTYIAMQYFWFRFDKSSYGKRALWFCLVFSLPFLGVAFYCFTVYTKAADAEEKAKESPALGVQV